MDGEQVVGDGKRKHTGTTGAPHFRDPVVNQAQVRLYPNCAATSLVSAMISALSSTLKLGR
jgi:hypothetical protein